MVHQIRGLNFVMKISKLHFTKILVCSLFPIFLISCSNECERKYPNLLGQEIVVDYPLFVSVFEHKEKKNRLLSFGNYGSLLANNNYKEIYQLSCGEKFQLSSFDNVRVSSGGWRDGSVCTVNGTVSTQNLGKITFSYPELATTLESRINAGRQLSLFGGGTCSVGKEDERIELNFAPQIELGQSVNIRASHHILDSNGIDVSPLVEIIPNVVEGEVERPSVRVATGEFYDSSLRRKLGGLKYTKKGAPIDTLSNGAHFKAERIGTSCFTGIFESKMGNTLVSTKCMDVAETVYSHKCVSISVDRSGLALISIDGENIGMQFCFDSDQNDIMKIDTTKDYSLIEPLKKISLHRHKVQYLRFAHPDLGQISFNILPKALIRNRSRVLALSIKAVQLFDGEYKNRGKIKYFGSEAVHSFYKISQNKNEYSLQDKYKYMDELLLLARDATELIPPLLDFHHQGGGLFWGREYTTKLLRRIGPGAIPILKSKVVKNQYKPFAESWLAILKKDISESESGQVHNAPTPTNHH